MIPVSSSSESSESDKNEMANAFRFGDPGESAKVFLGEAGNDRRLLVGRVQPVRMELSDLTDRSDL